MEIKKHVKSLYANLYINAAFELGLKVEIHSEAHSIAEISNDTNNIILFRNNTSANSSVASRIMKNKAITAIFLRKANIPVSQIQYYKKKENPEVNTLKDLILKDMANDGSGDFVLKASSGSLGKGVYVGIKTEQDVIDALNEIYSLRDAYVVLERFIQGSDFRVIVVDDKVVDIVKRIPAFVKGDGKDTIENLINKKNIERQKLSAHSINIDDNLLAKLRKSNKDLNYVPVADEVVVLRDICNLSLGGEVERVDLSKVHSDYLQIFQNMNSILSSRFVGIDIIANNLFDPIIDSKGVINEVNAAPHLSLQYVADTIEGSDHLKTLKNILKQLLYIS